MIAQENRQAERAGNRLLYMAMISLALHILILSSLLPVLSHPFRSRPVTFSLPVIRVSLVSESAREKRDTVKPETRKQRPPAAVKNQKPERAPAVPGKNPDVPLSVVPKASDLAAFTDKAVRDGQTAEPGSLARDPRAAGGGPSGKSDLPPGNSSFKSAGDGAATGPSSALPRYRSTPRPVYPVHARERGHEGRVLVSADVRADGQVSEARVHQSSGFPLLDEAAKRAVKSWTFEPARRMNLAVAATVMIPIRFSLQDRD